MDGFTHGWEPHRKVSHHGAGIAYCHFRSEANLTYVGVHSSLLRIDFPEASPAGDW